MVVLTRQMKNKIDMEIKNNRIGTNPNRYYSKMAATSVTTDSNKMNTRQSSSKNTDVIDLTQIDSDDDIRSTSSKKKSINTTSFNTDVYIKKEPGSDFENSDFETSTTVMRNCLRDYWDMVIPSARPIVVNAWKVSALYVFWILLHYITAHAYVQYCANPSLYGFLAAPFLISAPHCVAMRWVFSKGGTLIEGMWILLGTWLCSKLVTNP
jgi:hypothetical protein